MLIDNDKKIVLQNILIGLKTCWKMFPYLYKLYLTSSTMNNVVLDDMLRYDTSILFNPLN